MRSMSAVAIRRPSIRTRKGDTSMNEQKVIDYITKWAKEKDISSESDFYDDFQSDWFQEEVYDFVEEILKLSGVFK